ncbi:MAG: hypothetical protein RIG77_13390 [Cyclobacteriaceae bacterium]
MNHLNDILTQIELHSVEGIKRCFSEGTSPNAEIEGEALIYHLIAEYTRSPRFGDCVRTFVDFGLEFEDKVLLSVLLDDSENLNKLVAEKPELVDKRYTLRCAYTPMLQGTLIHICAEFNRTNCARVLVRHGADVNIQAGVDTDGFGGQTPVFHTVNQNNNQSAEMLEFLLANSADLTVTVKGLIWGKGYDWETLIPSVNPISYTIMGLLPQVHRHEKTIFSVVSKLLKHQYGIDYEPNNIPNKYLCG